MTWPYTAIGIGFALIGVFCSGYALWRYREVDEAVRRVETRSSVLSPAVMVIPDRVWAAVR